MKECKRCGYKKTWSGSGITCPFKDSDIFSENNWNCGIINQIRAICERAMEGDDYRLHYQYCDDEKYVTINIDDVEVNGEYVGLCLWVAWYKSRGGTDAMWVLTDNQTPRKPTYDELEAIIKFYNQ